MNEHAATKALRSRPGLPLRAAAAILAITGVSVLIYGVSLVARGSFPLRPYMLIAMLAGGLLLLLGAVGMYRGRKWGVLLATPLIICYELVAWAIIYANMTLAHIEFSGSFAAIVLIILGAPAIALVMILWHLSMALLERSARRRP